VLRDQLRDYDPGFSCPFADEGGRHQTRIRE